MHQSVLNRLVMMSFPLVNVAWDKGMIEAPFWHIGFWNMDCKFSIEYVMPHSTLTVGHAKGRLTMFGATRLHHWNAGFRYDVHVERFRTSNWSGPSVRPLPSHGAGYHTRPSTSKTWFDSLDAEFTLSWQTPNFSSQTSCFFPWFTIHALI